jgi:mannosyltransferase OCH1-like enzyme
MSVEKRVAYCWFGNNPKPRLIQKCIDSWKKNAPEYELIEINENNFDIESLKYTKQAYEAKRWAFVSDAARFVWLKDNNGITVDADVECLKPFTEDILSQRVFTCKESSGRWISATIASEANHPWVQRVLKYYFKQDFIYDPKNVTNTVILDEINKKWYKETKDGIIYLHEGVAIYDRHYFECKNWSTKQIELDKNSFCIHHYEGSWLH